MEVNDDFVSLREYKDDEKVIFRVCDAGVKKKIPICVISNYNSKLVKVSPATIQTLLSICPERKEVVIWNQNLSKYIRNFYQFAEAPCEESQSITCLDFWIKKSDIKATLEEHYAVSAYLPASERSTMLKMILGMAIRAYDYKPWEKRNVATGSNKGSIKVDLEKIKFSIDEDTVRKYLKEASETHLPTACTE